MEERKHEGANGRRVLVLEDEYFLADELQRWLSRQGATVVGPVRTVQQALAIIAEDDRIDAAVLDINLGSDSDAYPVADALRARDIPFVFATGYDRGHLRKDFAQVPHLTKPFEMAALGELLFGRFRKA